MTCDALWPDHLTPDGEPVTCHLEDGHGGLWHRWFHGTWQREGDAAIAWHTAAGKVLSAGWTPTFTYRVDEHGHLDGDATRHPAEAGFRLNLPPKPTRATK